MTPSLRWTVLVFGLQLGCHPMPLPPLPRHAERIRAIDEAWALAAARRDLDGMMAIYAPDAQELLPGLDPLVGRDAIRTFYQDLIRNFPRFAHEFHPVEITVAQSADLAVVRGTYRFIADTLQPEAVERGKFLGVWQRTETEWHLRYNISNASP